MTKPGWDYQLATLAVHAGQEPDPVTGASAPNIVMSNSFVSTADVSFSIETTPDDAPYLYTRWANPTVAQLEQKLAQLEGGEACIGFATGVAAASGLLLHLLHAGDHLVITDVGYAGVLEFVHGDFPRLGISYTTVDMSDLAAIERAMTPRTRLVYSETPSNPIVRLTDLRAVASIAHRHGAAFAVDATFATPVATRSLEFGADFVVHSLSKYIGGHGDALGGAVIGRADDVAALRRHVGVHLGAAMSPFNAWLIMRGAATLPLRMAAHARGATQIARFLEDDKRVKRVIYPGLRSHPQFDLATRQMKNPGGMLTFQVADGPAMARRFVERLAIFHYTVSLGHHRSLIFYVPTEPLIASSFKLQGPQLASYRQWAEDGIFRVSVGIEDPDDLCRDLDQALG